MPVSATAPKTVDDVINAGIQETDVFIGKIEWRCRRDATTFRDKKVAWIRGVASQMAKEGIATDEIIRAIEVGSQNSFKTIERDLSKFAERCTVYSKAKVKARLEQEMGPFDPDHAIEKCLVSYELTRRFPTMARVMADNYHCAETPRQVADIPATVAAMPAYAAEHYIDIDVPIPPAQKAFTAILPLCTAEHTSPAEALDSPDESPKDLPQVAELLFL